MFYIVKYNNSNYYDNEGNILEFDTFDEAVEFALETSELVFETEEIIKFGIVTLLKEHNYEINMIE